MMNNWISPLPNISMAFQVRTLFVLGIAIFYSAVTFAQAINLGRGELPLTVPSSYNAATATPLIVLLHGYGSSGFAQDAYMGFSRLADQYGFIFVAPDGTVDLGGRRFWNATPACCNFFNSTVNDSGYIASIIAEIKTRYNIDARRVYLIGHSNGGFMSYQTAYLHSDKIAAIVSFAGASHNEARAAPSRPVHVLQIHGSIDSTILYNGGSKAGNSYPGALQSTSVWRGYNGCSGVGKTGAARDLVSNLAGNETLTQSFQSGCKTGGSSELWTMNLASHIPTLATTFAAQIVEWLYAHPKSEWPSLYSGVTPASSLGLSSNNIGIFHEADAMIYSCVAIYSGGLPSSVNGVTKFDIGFEIVSTSAGTIRISKSRPFNSPNALNQNGALPDCSGEFETTTGLYKDTIQVGAQTLRVSFSLTDPANFELRLINYSNL